MKRYSATIPVVLVLLVTSACGSAVELSSPTWSGTWRGNGEGAGEGTLTIRFGGREEFGDMGSFDVDVIFHGPACETPEGVTGPGKQTAVELPPTVRFALQVGSSVYRFVGTRCAKEQQDHAGHAPEQLRDGPAALFPCREDGVISVIHGTLDPVGDGLDQVDRREATGPDHGDPKQVPRQGGGVDLEHPGEIANPVRVGQQQVMHDSTSPR